MKSKIIKMLFGLVLFAIILYVYPLGNILNTLINNFLTIAGALIILFFVVIALNQKILAIIVSVTFFFLGTLLFSSGIIKIRGFEGLGVSLGGLVYIIIGFLTYLIVIIIIYFQAKKRVN